MNTPSWNDLQPKNLATINSALSLSEDVDMGHQEQPEQPQMLLVAFL